MTLTQKRIALMKMADELKVHLVVIVADGQGTIEMGSNIMNRNTVAMLLNDAVSMAKQEGITEAIDGMDVGGDA